MVYYGHRRPFLGVSTFVIGLPLIVLSFWVWVTGVPNARALGSLKCVHAGHAPIDGLYHLNDGQSMF